MQVYELTRAGLYSQKIYNSDGWYKQKKKLRLVTFFMNISFYEQQSHGHLDTLKERGVKHLTLSF